MALELTSFLVSPVSILPLRGGPTTPFPAAWGPSVSLHPAIPAEAGLATLLSPRVAKLRSSASSWRGLIVVPGGQRSRPSAWFANQTSSRLTTPRDWRPSVDEVRSG